MKSNNSEMAQYSGIAEYFPEEAEIFKQVQVNIDMNVPWGSHGIGKVLHAGAEAKVLKSYMVPTPRSMSHEGQIMTGLMLVVEGRVEANIEYMADDPGESISTARFISMFSTFIVLDKRFTFDSDVAVTPYIEDIYVRQINKRMLFGSVMLLLDAVPSGV